MNPQDHAAAQPGIGFGADDRLTAARDRLARLRAEAHATAADAADIAARLAQQSYSAWSARRSVRVTVGADALVQGVEFTEAAVGMAPRALAAATLDAHRRALALLRATVEETVSTGTATDPAIGSTILVGARDMLPAPEQPRLDDRR